MTELLVRHALGSELHSGAELLRIGRVIREHVVVAGDRYFRLDVADQIGRFPMREIVKAAIDASDHCIRFVFRDARAAIRDDPYRR